ncbi:MAG: glutaredoxin family protein [Myxococcales bacterium]
MRGGPALLLCLLFSMPLAGCKRAEDAAPPKAAPAEPVKLTLTRDRKDLLFTFVDEQGVLRDVDSADKVPENRRRQVMVRDLSRSPEELRSDQFLYLADLTREENGHIPYTVVSRYSLERALQELDTLTPEDISETGEVEQKVVLYGTTWCGACAAAKSWFEQKGIAFVDRDIEADPKAAKDMALKAKRAGLEVGGVPVIDVRGALVLGFDPARIERLLQ